MKVNFNEDKKIYEISNKINIFDPNKINNQNYLDITKKNNNTTSNINTYQQLQEKILNSLYYLEKNNLLPSLLPNTLNIKFIGKSIFDKIKVNLYGNPIAQLKIPNTLFISPQLLPQNINEKNNDLPSYLNSHLKDKNQVFDLVLFHEIGHVIFNHNFSELNNINDKLFASRSYFKKFEHSFKTNYLDIPLYQINRSLEEQFADSFSSLVLNHRYNTQIQNFINLRNSVHPDLITKGFNIDINRLSENFKNIKNLDLKKNGIDNTLLSLFELSLQITISKIKEKSPYNSDIIDNLQNNLALFNIKTNYRETRNSVIEKTENLVKNQISFKKLTSSNIEDKLNKLIEKSNEITTNKNKL